jgi:glutathione synthase/RimK-type ligase-like ATP-grasp enzyme
VNVYLVVDQRCDWPFEVPGATVVTAREYLADTALAAAEARVINLCRTDRYQGRGYYVSLLAEARGQAPMPRLAAIEDLHTDSVEAARGRDGAPAWPVQASQEYQVEVLACFGRDVAGDNDAVARVLLDTLQAPLVEAQFTYDGAAWRLTRVRLLSARELAPAHARAAAQAAAQWLNPCRTRGRDGRPALAILFNADAPDPPSNAAAIERFCAAGSAMGMRIEVIGRDDLARLPAFDGLLIRDTTHVNHYTYQFARRAAAEGLVVIDDPASILRCTNKVYLNELLSRHQVSVPRTVVVDREGAADRIEASLGFPCIVKEPDGAFSLGVEKVEGRTALEAVLAKYFERSALVLAQEWLPTSFDWRVGVLDGRALYVCKYMMAPGHWQVVKRERGRKLEGATLAMPVGEAPEPVVRAAVRAATLIGDGLYGVDLKQVGDRCYVIEVNDNPNIDAGNEDSVLGEALYREVLGVFLRRIRDPASRAAA